MSFREALRIDPSFGEAIRNLARANDSERIDP